MTPRIRPLVLTTVTLTLAAAVPALLRYAAPGSSSASGSGARNGRVLQYWPDGGLKADATYHADAYEGEYRTWYASGRPYERKHYRNGREEGTQQAWTEAGTLYLNYEVSGGRRFGLVNAAPCEPVAAGADVVDRRRGPVAEGGSAAGDSDPRAQDLAGKQQAETAARTTLPYYDAPAFTPTWRPVEHVVADFSLTTQSGQAISSTSLRGRPYVASFIYTQCAALCPLIVRQLARVQRAIEPGTAHIVSFSVMPDADTPQQLSLFARDGGIDAARWSLVTGSKRTIYGLARASYFADDSRLDPGDPTAFLHTEKLLLVDGEGHLRGVYNGTQPHAVDQLIADLALLTDRS